MIFNPHADRIARRLFIIYQTIHKNILQKTYIEETIKLP